MALSPATMVDESELWAMANWGPPDLNPTSHAAGLAEIDAIFLLDPNEAIPTQHAAKQIIGTDLRPTEGDTEPITHDTTPSSASSSNGDVVTSGMQSSLETQRFHATGGGEWLLPRNFASGGHVQVRIDAHDLFARLGLNESYRQFDREWVASLAPTWLAPPAGFSFPVHPHQSDGVSHQIRQGPLPRSSHSHHGVLNLQPAVPHPQSQDTMPFATSGNLSLPLLNIMNQRGLADSCNVFPTEPMNPNYPLDALDILDLPTTMDEFEEPITSSPRCSAFVTGLREQIDVHQREDFPPCSCHYHVTSYLTISSDASPQPHTESLSAIPDDTDVDIAADAMNEPLKGRLTCTPQIVLHESPSARNRRLRVDFHPSSPHLLSSVGKSSLMEEMREEETEVASETPSRPAVPSFAEKLAGATQGLPERPIPLVRELFSRNNSHEGHVTNKRRGSGVEACLLSHEQMQSSMAAQLPAAKIVSESINAGDLSPNAGRQHNLPWEGSESNGGIEAQHSIKDHLIQAQETHNVQNGNSLSIDHSYPSSDSPPPPTHPERRYTAAAAPMTKYDSPDSSNGGRVNVLKRDYNARNSPSPDILHLPSSPRLSKREQPAQKRAKTTTEVVAPSIPKAEAPTSEQEKSFSASSDLSSPPPSSSTMESMGDGGGGGVGDGGGGDADDCGIGALPTTATTITSSTTRHCKAPPNSHKTKERKGGPPAMTTTMRVQRDDEEEAAEELWRRKGQSSFTHEMNGLGGAKRPSPRKTRKQRRNEEDAKPNARAAVHRRRSGGSGR